MASWDEANGLSQDTSIQAKLNHKRVSVNSLCIHMSHVAQCYVHSQYKFAGSTDAITLWQLTTQTHIMYQPPWQTAMSTGRQQHTAQRSAAQHSTAQRSAAQRSAAQHSTAQRSAAQRSAAQRSASQHCTTQQCTAQQCTTTCCDEFMTTTIISQTELHQLATTNLMHVGCTDLIRTGLDPRRTWSAWTRMISEFVSSVQHSTTNTTDHTLRYMTDKPDTQHTRHSDTWQTRHSGTWRTRYYSRDITYDCGKSITCVKCSCVAGLTPDELCCVKLKSRNWPAATTVIKTMDVTNVQITKNVETWQKFF